jgi:hypothetical protein
MATNQKQAFSLIGPFGDPFFHGRRFSGLKKKDSLGLGLEEFTRLAPVLYF